MSWRTTIAVGGMTCSSCVTAITEGLTAIDGVTTASVSLAAQIATVTFKGGHSDAQRIVQAIEDMGYDASIADVLPAGIPRPQSSQTVGTSKPRTICLDIRSSNKSTSPIEINHQITAIPGVSITSRRVTKTGVILEVSYTPAPPEFTVRYIVNHIETVLPETKAFVHHPPTAEEMAEKLNSRHRFRLLLRILLTTAVAIPTFIIGVVYMSLIPPHNHIKMFLMKPWLLGVSRTQIALWIMATPVYFFAADAFHKPAIREIYNMWKPSSKVAIEHRFLRFGSMNLLMSLGTSVAYFASLYQLINTMATSAAEAHDSNFYFDSVVFLTLFLLVGRLLEAYTKSKTSDAVGALSKLRPTTALLLSKSSFGSERVVEVPADWLELGDQIRVPHGASPPCDGIIVEGETVFDESSLTGESRPITKKVGDDVYPATTNQHCPVTITVTKVMGETTLDNIVEVVRQGQSKRAPIERAADMITAYFVPVIILASLLTWSTWFALGRSGVLPESYKLGGEDWASFALNFAIAMFVVACPCGLGLAAPTAIFVGVGLAAKHGILVRGGGAAFENARKVDTIVFDKTGTLTVGDEPIVTEHAFFFAQDDSYATQNSLLSAIRNVEEHSSHPLAKSLVAFCANMTENATIVKGVEEIPGKGLGGFYTEDATGHEIEIIIGNEVLMADAGVVIDGPALKIIRDWQRAANSIVLVASRPTADTLRPVMLQAAFAISDTIRPEAAVIIKDLRLQGKQIYMLTGDNAITARAVAAQVGINADTHVIAGVRPTDKAQHITRLKEGLSEATGRRHYVAMIGDGINDAPALAAADIAIAIGSGTDVAISAADFVLVGGNLASVISLLRLSRVIFRRILFNFGWAAVYNIIMIPFAAGCLYSFGVRLDPVWASLAMALSSLSVIAWSLLLEAPWWMGGFRKHYL